MKTGVTYWTGMRGTDMSQMDGSFIYIPYKLHLRREHESSTTSNLKPDDLQREELTLLNKIWGNRLVPRLITWLLGFAK